MTINNFDQRPLNAGTKLPSAAIAPRAEKSISKRALVFIIKIAFAAFVMLMLVQRIELPEIKSAFRSARLTCILIALLLLIPNIYIQFYKWRYLVRLLKPPVTNREIFQSLLAGFTFGFITPGRIGEFGRAFFIKDCSWVSLLGVTFLDKFFSLGVVIFLGSLGLMYNLSGQLYLYTLIPIIIFTVITLIVIYYILFHPEILRGFLYSLNIILPFRDKIKLLMGSLDAFHRRQAFRLLLFTLGFNAIFLIQFYILVCAFEPAPIVPTMFALAAIMLVKSLLPISVGDLGVRESAAIFFLGQIGRAHV